jgi:hypothetical protein
MVSGPAVIELRALLDEAETLIDQRLAALMVATKTISQVVSDYTDQLTNAVYDVWNGHSDAIDFRRAHKAMLREYAPRAFIEGMREGGTFEIDEEDRSEMEEQVSDWLATQLTHVNDFSKAVGEARKSKDQRPAILERVSMWADSLRSLGDMGRAYALANEKVQWTLGETEEHCDTCLRLSRMKPHRVSWFTSRGYIPRQNGSTTLDCGGWLCDCSGKNKKGETVL